MNKSIPFSKMQGLGNDFVVINNLEQHIKLTPEQIRLISDRHFGIGCDQLLLLEPAPHNKANFGYRIYNNDGTESGQCGNGVRCLARFIHQQKISDKTTLTIATSSSTMQTQILENGLVKVNMGEPNFIPDKIPLLLPRTNTYTITVSGITITFFAVSLGNPHIVIRVENFDNEQIQMIGKALNNRHAIFPEGVNVGFMQIVDREHIHLRVYERGAGETKACGSGACAAMVAAVEQGWCDNQAEVKLPGGTLTIQYKPNEPLWMTGPAVFVFDGMYFI